ncbi:hypothetical protein ACFCYB_31980 [Streptomyces sp. NPDC056309]
MFAVVAGGTPAVAKRPFLSGQKQRMVVEVLQQLVDWTRACTRSR